jgi:hypothetical protein
MRVANLIWGIREPMTVDALRLSLFDCSFPVLSLISAPCGICFFPLRNVAGLLVKILSHINKFCDDLYISVRRGVSKGVEDRPPYVSG